MFEISVSQMKNCIQDLEEQEQALQNLLSRLETVYTNFDSLVDDKSDKKAIRVLINDVVNEKRGVSEMKRALNEVIRCYESTEQKIMSTGQGTRGRNQFSLTDLGNVSQMLETLNISFK